MQLEFPRLLYKDGGVFDRVGGKYSMLLVHNETEMKTGLEDGWFASLPEAIEPKKDEKIAAEDPQPEIKVVKAKKVS